MSLISRATTVATRIASAQSAGTVTVIAAAPNQRPFIEWARIDAGALTSATLMIGSRTIDTSITGSPSTLGGTVIGKVNESITVVFAGAGSDGAFEMTVGRVDDEVSGDADTA